MKKTRPIAPHLQIYKPQITSILSIFHRITGLALLLGIAGLTWLVVALSQGTEAFAQFQICTQSLYGQILIVAILFSLFYHLLNGIRHLFWDIGKGYELENVTRSGVAVVVFSILFTLGFYFL